jgi:two-component sensor histidine kinase
MAEIHELLHNSDDISKVDFHECVDVVGGDLLSTYGMSERVSFRVNGDVELGLDLATQSSLIVSELISNSLKHAFPGDMRGDIVVELTQDNNGEVTISVADNGVGLSEDIDWRHPVTIGLDLVNGLIIQIGGTLDLDRSEGTNFTIKFMKRWRKSAQ